MFGIWTQYPQGYGILLFHRYTVAHFLSYHNGHRRGCFCRKKGLPLCQIPVPHRLDIGLRGAFNLSPPWARLLCGAVVTLALESTAPIPRRCVIASPIVWIRCQPNSATPLVAMMQGC